jgi:hypothetical protein
MNLQPANSCWRLTLLVTGAFLILLAIGLPVDLIVRKAIPPGLAAEIAQKPGGGERVAELQAQFRAGLMYFRIASSLLGIWLALLASLWSRLAGWAAGLQVTGTADPGCAGGIRKSEIVFPIAWALLSACIAIPLLTKGFDISEVVNLEMLAVRGPLVTMASQNLISSIGQPGFTVIESLFVLAFGESELVARLPALLLGVLVFFPLYFTARRFGPVLLANLACGGLAINGFFLFYSTYARGYALALSAYMGCIATTLSLRRSSTWWRWALLSGLIVIAGYSHQASILYVFGLCLLIMLERIRWVTKEKAFSAVTVLRSQIQPGVAFVSALLFLFFLYSVGIPCTRKCTSIYSQVTDYYMAYHMNPRFLRVMLESWSWGRDIPWAGWLQGALCLAGAALAGLAFREKAAYLVAPALISLLFIGIKRYPVYPRFFLHFLPVYVFFCAYAVWSVVSRLRSARQKWPVIAGVWLSLLVACALTLQRLYSMERCGIVPAVRDARAVMKPGERLMGVLDGYVGIKHYYPEVVSGYKDHDFRAGLSGDRPPEYLITPAYLDYDIPGGWNALREKKYELFKKYPSWLDVDDDQDSIYLYVVKERGKGA